jgi:hypothetical protein
MRVIRGVNVFPSAVEAALLDDPALGGQYAIVVDRRGAAAARGACGARRAQHRRGGRYGPSAGASRAAPARSSRRDRGSSRLDPTPGARQGDARLRAHERARRARVGAGAVRHRERLRRLTARAKRATGARWNALAPVALPGGHAESHAAMPLADCGRFVVGRDKDISDRSRAKEIGGVGVAGDLGLLLAQEFTERPYRQHPVQDAVPPRRMLEVPSEPLAGCTAPKLTGKLRRGSAFAHEPHEAVPAVAYQSSHGVRNTRGEPPLPPRVGVPAEESPGGAAEGGGESPACTSPLPLHDA